MESILESIAQANKTQIKTLLNFNKTQLKAMLL
jgi:hypothetical protein